jgi:hypothetical protein
MRMGVKHVCSRRDSFDPMHFYHFSTVLKELDGTLEKYKSALVCDVNVCALDSCHIQMLKRHEIDVIAKLTPTFRCYR